MTITVLTDNVAGSGFLAEHGLSFLIKHNDQKILFDTGHSDVFLKNAGKMDIDVQKEVETVVLSHGHWDHGNGLRYLSGKMLIMHPSALIPRYRKKDHSGIGLALSDAELRERFNVIACKRPFLVGEDIIFLGEVPKLNDFEAQITPFVDENGAPDFVPDDSALAIVRERGLVIVTGCSHSGICNIIEYARKVTGVGIVDAVVGGFHLRQDNQQLRETVKYFKSHTIEHIFPSHCTELPALAAFYREFKIRQLKTGVTLEL